MENFPTITEGNVIPLSFTQEAMTDPVIRTNFESGAIQTRSRYTKIIKKWTVAYEFLSESDKTLLVNFELTVKHGEDSFYWTNPQDSTVYTVKLLAPIAYHISGKPNLWSAELSIGEAYPNSADELKVQTVIAQNFDVSTSDITVVGRVLDTGDQADASELYAYFEYGVNRSDLIATASELMNVSDINLQAKIDTFSLESNILTSRRDFYYRAVLSSADSSDLVYGELKSITSDHLGYF